MVNITPTEFELHAKALLELADREITSLEIDHNQKERGHDGSYQIDVKVTFNLFGADFKVLVECKHYNSKINREKVQILHAKLKSLGAHKGILMSTKGFQSGAVNYAKAHGIALVEVTTGGMTYATKFLTTEDIKNKFYNSEEADNESELLLYWIESTNNGESSTYLNAEYSIDFFNSIFYD